MTRSLSIRQKGHFISALLYTHGLPRTATCLVDSQNHNFQQRNLWRAAVAKTNNIVRREKAHLLPHALRRARRASIGTLTMRVTMVPFGLLNVNKPTGL